MFFTRLIVVALSFGTLAQVFAAPIDTNPGRVSADVSAPTTDGSLTRRDDLTFTAVVAEATTELNVAKGEIATLIADPTSPVTTKIATVMSKVASAMHSVSAKFDSLKAPGVGKDEILLNVDSVGKTTSEVVVSDIRVMYQTVDDICGLIEKLQSIGILKNDLVNIRSEVASITSQAHAFVIGVLSVVLGLDGWSNNVVAHLGNLIALAE